MIRNWSDFKYEVADKLFTKQLDEAFKDGIKMGAETATHKLSFEVKLKRRLTLTKTEERGYNYAIAAIDRVKPEIAKITGARL